ncbi:ABC transporter permease [Paraglaciecola sp. 20A4]|uniref:ABC transporter permease n=1 Tax=Paraglaciecola sp. 20A4 TaxID=2687288 RepID=UPI00140D08DB|nr:ABC transporter permease [Paraglaciecola sp. 20A4]
MLVRLTLASVMARKLMAGLTVISIAVSMFVLFSVEHLRGEVRQNFERAVSGVDLIVGARTSQLNLLLYSVFHVGSPSSNISWNEYVTLANAKSVKWAIPISLGDSHQGFPVVGTTEDYFTYFRYGNKNALDFALGQSFTQPTDIVLGATVAQTLGYQIGQEVVLAHGSAKVSFTHHKQYPFITVGVLHATGTPIDQSVFVPIKSIDGMHSVHQTSTISRHTSEHTGNDTHEDDHAQHDTIESDLQVSAIYLGLTSKISTLQVQRVINTDQQAPMSAILPGVALAELWNLMKGVETSLSLVSSLILLAAMLGMLTMLLASIHERQREIAVLRALGANTFLIVLMIECEAIFLALSGCVIGYVMTNVSIWLLADYVQTEYGLLISPLGYSDAVLEYVLLALGLAMLLALVPALSAYRSALSNGLNAK